MNQPGKTRLCGLLFAAVVVPVCALGQDGPADDQSSKTTREKLVEIAEARVEQHEKRLEAIRALGKLRRELNEVQLEQAKSRVDSVKAEVDAAVVLNEQQKRELARMRELFETGAVTPSKLAEMETQVATSVARLAHARNNLKRADAEVRSAALELEHSKWNVALQEAEATIELLDAKSELVRLLEE